ncbi:MAG: cyclic nucleotide-binding domain-containing protein [Pseudomonadota bacterium]|nr:cyclic nucleotide-binding domain-containing protein [Pseudomonadota bacterium]
MAAIARTQSFAGRQTMVDEGEPAESLCNITSGAVKPYKLLPDGRRQSTGFLFEGDFLGSVLNDYYSYTAEAVNDVTLGRFPKARVEALSEEFPKFEKQLPEVASNELAQVQDQMLLLSRKTSQGKVVSFLLSFSKRSHARGAPASPISLPMNRADIADCLGLTTETVGNTFTSLRGSDAISLLAGNSVPLENFESLFELADGS